MSAWSALGVLNNLVGDELVTLWARLPARERLDVEEDGRPASVWRDEPEPAVILPFLDSALVAHGLAKRMAGNDGSGNADGIAKRSMDLNRALARLMNQVDQFAMRSSSLPCCGHAHFDCRHRLRYRLTKVDPQVQAARLRKSNPLGRTARIHVGGRSSGCPQGTYPSAATCSSPIASIVEAAAHALAPVLAAWW